jgi:hypothetical protein
MKKAIVITATVAAAVIGVSPAGAAGPPTNGCATENRSSEVDHGWLYFAVADLTALGYRVPALIDDPANGGNGDGFICGVPQGNLTTPRGTQLYLFSDNLLGPVK